MFARFTRAKFLRNAAITALAAIATAACSGGAEMVPASFTPEPADLQRTYRLGVGDKLKITVFGEDNLSGQFEVNALGAVSVPLVGEIPAAQRPIAEFRDAVARKLGDGYLKNPRVTVEVMTYRPIYVHGEVKSGGEFPFKSGLRLRDAVALAGGFTYRANQNHVVIYREGHGEFNAATMSTFAVMPGDNIRVPERFF